MLGQTRGIPTCYLHICEAGRPCRLRRLQAHGKDGKTTDFRQPASARHHARSIGAGQCNDLILLIGNDRIDRHYFQEWRQDHRMTKPLKRDFQSIGIFPRPGDDEAHAINGKALASRRPWP